MQARGVNLRSAAGVVVGLVAGFTLALILGSISPAGFRGVVGSLLWVYTNPTPLVFSLALMGPIACSAIGLTLAYRARFITIGSEGQVLLGSITTLWLIEYSGLNLHPVVAVLTSIMLGGFTGALLGLLIGLLRVYANANEILVSLMLNYTMLYLLNHLASGPWRVGAFAITKSIGEEYRVGPIIVAIVPATIALLYWFILAKTKLGLAIEVYGRAPRVAETYGLNPKIVVLSVALLSGFTPGVGGALMMLGFQHNLSPMSVSPGYGYMGVLVSWLSANNPLVALLASWFFSSILVLGRSLQASGLPIGYVLAIQSIIVLSVMIARKLTARWGGW
jgi:simple sugar transport system permease protein